MKRIEYEDTKEFILRKHYAQRMPSISWAFGLFKENVLVGVVTVGKPASAPLCKGILGEEHAHKVYELNRLVTDEGLEKKHYFIFSREGVAIPKARRFGYRILCR